MDTFCKSALPELKKALGGTNKIKGARPTLRFPELEWLELQDNAISSINNLTTSQIHLFECINLSGNSIGELPKALKLPKLKSILLQKNIRGMLFYY